MTRLRSLALASLLLTLPAAAPPQDGGDLLPDAFQGVLLGDSLATVTRKLDGLQDELERTTIEAPYHPLARESQVHLVARGLTGLGLDEAAFTFADDRLVSVEARGGVVEGLLPVLEGEPTDLLGFRVWPTGGHVARPEEDVLWFLGPEALHPHLYQWSNPDLSATADAGRPYAAGADRPTYLRFGASVDELLPELKRAASHLWREEIEEPWLPTQPKKQFQINALGLEFAGFPRKFEAVFGDDRLQLAWILTGKGEENRVRKALVKAFGPPVHRGDNWEAFDDWRVALRKDKPEVLMIDEALVPLYREQIRGAG